MSDNFKEVANSKTHITPIQSLKEIPCVILCGGKSSRMGEDKTLLPFGKYDTLVQYQYERLKPHFKNVYLSAKSDKFNFLSDKSNIIYDTSKISSPMIALKTIFNKIKDEYVFIITVDTPFVTIDSMDKIIKSINNNEICVAKTERTHNLCGIFKKAIISKIDNLLKDDIHKIGFILKESATIYLEFSNEDEFINLNTPSDYKKSLTLIS